MNEKLEELCRSADIYFDCLDGARNETTGFTCDVLCRQVTVCVECTCRVPASGLRNNICSMC